MTLRAKAAVYIRVSQLYEHMFIVEWAQQNRCKRQRGQVSRHGSLCRMAVEGCLGAIGIRPTLTGTKDGEKHFPFAGDSTGLQSTHLT
jgi:hypothetical protein